MTTPRTRPSFLSCTPTGLTSQSAQSKGLFVHCYVFVQSCTANVTYLDIYLVWIYMVTTGRTVCSARHQSWSETGLSLAQSHGAGARTVHLPARPDPRHRWWTWTRDKLSQWQLGQNSLRPAVRHCPDPGPGAGFYIYTIYRPTNVSHPCNLQEGGPLSDHICTRTFLNPYTQKIFFLYTFHKYRYYSSKQD